MNWLIAAAFGACGGAVVSVVAFCTGIFSWQHARSAARAKRARRLPKLIEFVDPLPDIAVLVTRMLLGAVAGVLFHSQVDGIQAAVAVGAAAPGLLSQYGASRSSRTVSLDEGTDPLLTASKRGPK